MSFSTRFTELLGIAHPVIQAPMAGGGDTVDLVAAVSAAGGLGSIGAAYLTPEQIRERSLAVRKHTAQPFAINLFAPTPVPETDSEQMAAAVEFIAPYYRELGLPFPEPPSPPLASFVAQLEACLETEATLFSFTFGCLSADVVQKIKSRGKLVAGTATTVEEALLLAEAGVDAIVAQGAEAGGHRGTFTSGFEAGMVGTLALVPQIVDAVPVPVIASGGIMDGRGIAAALALGASAAQMGTAFLTCDEAGIPAAYKRAILTAREDQTQVTRAFSGRPARGIRNRLLCDYETAGERILPFPVQNTLTRQLRTGAAQQNRAEYLSLWAGQGVRMARRHPAAALMQALDEELTRCIAGLRQTLPSTS